MLSRVHKHTNVSLTVDAEVASREDFNAVSDAGADGIVIGSRLTSIIEESPQGNIPRSVETYCRELCGKGEPTRARSRSVRHLHPTPSQVPAAMENSATTPSIQLPMCFGEFGGRYVPEVLFTCLLELEELYKSAIADSKFWKEFESHYGYMNRPSELYYAEKLTRDAGGAGIWLKREDLSVQILFIENILMVAAMLNRNHTGSHKINNAVGQVFYFTAFRIHVFSHTSSDRSSSLNEHAGSVSSLVRVPDSMELPLLLSAHGLGWNV
jgi:tryptophan synthase